MCELVDTTATKSCQAAIKTDILYLVLSEQFKSSKYHTI